jgi:hypothetical protein
MEFGMKQILAGIAGAFALLVVIYVLGFLATGGDLAIYRFWAPKQVDAQREVFTHSQSYVQGKIQNINQECFAYHTAEGAQKAALAGEIRNEAATIPLSKLTPDEQACVAEARGE